MIQKNTYIPFNKPYIAGKEFAYIEEAYQKGQLAGDGVFTMRCHQWLERYTGTKKALLTHSCTAALEMAAILLDIQPGDEIIMPSYTFVSTANAFVLRGGVPVFVDIREDTLNINEKLIEAAITSYTKAIVPVHYAGVACEMDVILDVAKRHNLMVVEDAAQGLGSFYKGRALGSIGDLGTLSFHETKNFISGEGGALLVNNENLIARAEVIREKGTDRSKFLRGEIDKYTWQDIGSSFLPGELISAFLLAQFDEADNILNMRLQSYEHYHLSLNSLENQQKIRRPIVSEACHHNAHMYYVLLPSNEERKIILNTFKDNNILSVSHYVPLHSSPAGKKYGRMHGLLPVTNHQHECLIRLPLWTSIPKESQDVVINILKSNT